MKEQLSTKNTAIDQQLREKIKLEYYFGYINYETGARVFPNLGQLAKRHDVAYTAIRQWASREGWRERKKELAREREVELQKDVIKTMKELNRDQIIRLGEIQQRYDANLEAGIADVSTSDSLRAMNMERDILEDIHGVKDKSNTSVLFQILQKVVKPAGEPDSWSVLGQPDAVDVAVTDVEKPFVDPRNVVIPKHGAG